ncbi:MAG: DUF3696 domain-containing protein [Actinomycetales bacterium]|nr:DUF3696 domain-containing protein [Actinomycetales bacterium]
MITEIRLANFKAFREAQIRLEPLTLLTGVNAVGKSTVLQALAVLRQSYDADMLKLDGGLMLNGEYAEIGTGADLLHDDFAPDADGRPVVRVTVDADGVSRSWSASIARTEDREADVLRWDSCDPAGGSPVFTEGFQYLRADRVVPAVTYPRSYDVAVRRRSLGSRGEHTVNFLRVNRDARVPEVMRHSGSPSATLMSQTETWLQDLCPGVNLEAAGISGADLVQLSYGFFGRAGISSSQIRYRPTNVGFGLTYVLPVVVACLSATEGSLILLENPEAHLHPRGQSAVAGLVARAAASGAQVVVETHSDHVLNGIRLAVKRGVLPGAHTAVHYVDRAKQTDPDCVPPVRVESPAINDDGMLSSWPAGFFDEWENTLDQLLDGEE